MKDIVNIILPNCSPDQLLIQADSVLSGKRFITNDAESFLVDEALQYPIKTPFQISVRINGPSSVTSSEITKAINKHFEQKKETSLRKLRNTLNMGWKNLLVGIAFLGLLVFAVVVATEVIPEGGFSTTIRELLIILGWVALWRPADLLLYEWRPFKRDADLFQQLADAKVEVTGVHQLSSV
jgi:hypothetical protein